MSHKTPKRRQKRMEETPVQEEDEATGGWWREIAEEGGGGGKVNKETLVALRQRAAALHGTAQRAFESNPAASSSKRSTGDTKWMQTVLRSGTTSDRVAALTLMIQEAPPFRLKTLDQLLALAGKKARREAQLAIESLRDLFINNLLPDRPLRRVEEQRGLAALAGPLSAHHERLLVLFHFEEQLKLRFAQFVSLMESGLRDTIAHFRQRVIRALYLLVTSKPDHEAPRLLSLLANKLGDPENKVASQASYLLTLAMNKVPRLKKPVIVEIQGVLSRNNVSIRTTYYGVITLNQLMLARHDSELSNELLNFYFTIFKTALNVASPVDVAGPAKHDHAKKDKRKQKKRKDHKRKAANRTAEADDDEDEAQPGWIDSKLLGALLTGVNRTFPYASFKNGDENSALFDSHLDSLFKIVHVSSFNKAVQALLLIFQLMSRKSTIGDRFYRALYDKLLSLRDVFGSSKQSVLLNVLYKSLKIDDSIARTGALLKRLLQVCAHARPGFVCGVLLMISELVKARPSVLALLQQPEENQDETEDANYAVYDPRKRDPQFAGAEKTCIWELAALAVHYHPSVAKFAKSVLLGASIVYDSDPLVDFSLAAFLDRFIEKKPKGLAPKPTAEKKKRSIDDMDDVFDLGAAENGEDDEPPLEFPEDDDAGVIAATPDLEGVSAGKDGGDEEEDARLKRYSAALEEDSSDPEVGQFDDDDLDPDDDDIMQLLGDEDLDEGEEFAGSSGRSSFAAAEEFAELLEDAGKPENRKLQQWESRLAAPSNYKGWRRGGKRPRIK